jgi:hypothetical protein
MRIALMGGVLWMSGCGLDSEALLAEGEDEGLEFAASELNESKILQFVNSAEATIAVLNGEVGLDIRAANGIVARRNGADTTPGTPDDRPFLTLAEVDAIPYVGATALARLDTYASRLGTTPGAVTIEGIAFTEREAADTLAVVNGPLLDRVTLSSSASQSIRTRRPFADLPAVAAAPYIGPTALTALRSYVRANPISAPPGVCTGTGGTYDGVKFTQAEECKAVEFLNRARFSEMAGLPASARLAAYLAGPDGVWQWKRTSAWASLAPFSNFTGIGATALNGLKASTAAWTANGASSDTVASTWTNRMTLANGPVLFEQVYVVKVLPEIYGDGGYTWQCAELRDAPGAANYVYGCYPHFTCDGGDCWGDAAGKVRLVYGTLRRTTLPGFGGWRISLGR